MDLGSASPTRGISDVLRLRGRGAAGVTLVRVLVLSVGAACVMAGCDTYQAAPLRLSEHLRSWTATNLGQPRVQMYSQSALAALCGPGARLNVADGLDLSEAEAVALYLNPDLRLARAKADVPLASAHKSGLWDDPFVLIEALHIIEAVWSPWVLLAGVGITIPVSGRLEAEKERAWAEYSAGWRALAVAEWELLSKFRAVWLNYAAKCQEIRSVEDYVKRTGEIRASAEKLVEVGELFPTDARLFAIDQESQASELLGLRGQAERLRLSLLDLMGLPPDIRVTLNVKLCTFQVRVPPDHRPCEIVRRHPRVALLRAEYMATEKTMKREILKQYPDIAIGPMH